MKVLPLMLLLGLSMAARSQATESLSEEKFFEEDAVLDVRISMDMKSMIKNKMKENFKMPARIATTLPDGTLIDEPVTIEARGNYRRTYCYLPPLKVNFRHSDTNKLAPLGSLKLVNVCEYGRDSYNQYVLKEYLTYKIYNLITDRSFRVRLLRITYVDKEGNWKPIEAYGFLIEDVKDMARRLGYVERKRAVKHTEAADRHDLTRVSVFQYMIGNTDWSVPVKHNIRLIVPKDDTNQVPVPVPYDFDHAGLVKTSYAEPPPNLDIKDVTERSYRGFPRSMEELETTLNSFRQAKPQIYALLNGFSLLPQSTREEMIHFLDSFYAVLGQPWKIKAEFIQNARTN